VTDMGGGRCELVPLPLALDFAGMPGCTLYVSGTLVAPVAHAAGVAELMLPVRSDPLLVRGVLFGQGLVIDPPANPFGASASNAVELRIGAR